MGWNLIIVVFIVELLGSLVNMYRSIVLMLRAAGKSWSQSGLFGIGETNRFTPAHTAIHPIFVLVDGIASLHANITEFCQIIEDHLIGLIGGITIVKVVSINI
ncbi:hypothetical protein H0E87_000088 [Populus deltoides]|uniref:Uncharacterized protein n=1 Tax=Populus deltoides TaxID=3696 RepID=A0A8T2ZLD2_POPDE|nr:hypothetical protein H0E87_000088 [Populus deltoides]